VLQGQILDSKEFYAPIITPYEAQLAFTPEAAHANGFRLDFDSLLGQQQQVWCLCTFFERLFMRCMWPRCCVHATLCTVSSWPSKILQAAPMTVGYYILGLQTSLVVACSDDRSMSGVLLRLLSEVCMMQARLTEEGEDEETVRFSLIDGSHHAAVNSHMHSNDFALAQHASRKLYVQRGAQLLAYLVPIHTCINCTLNTL